MTGAQPPGSSVRSARGADAETQRWLAVLRDDAPERDQAITDLHGLLLRAARAELHRRGDHIRVTGPELDDLAYHAAADARTDPRDVGCDEALAVLHIYVDLVLDVVLDDASAGSAADRFPGVAAHLLACGSCGDDYEGLLAAVGGWVRP